MDGDGDAVPTATPTFATTPDSGMALTTWSDSGRHPKFKMAATKPDVETTFERN